MKILHIISQRPDSTGSGIYLQHILAEAAAAGHRNMLLCGVQNKNLPTAGDLALDRISYVRFETQDNPEKIIGMSDVMPYPSRTFRELDKDQLSHYLNLFTGAVEAAVQDFQPDLIHCHHLWLVTSLVARRFSDIAVTASCHGSELRQFHQCPHLQDMVRQGCRALRAVCALTQAQRTEIALLYGIDLNNITVVGAGFDNRLFFDRPREAKEQDENCRLIYGGKLSRAKGIPWLLEALHRLRDYPFHLHLVGSGSGIEYERCLELAERLGSRATIHGAVSQSELASLMRASHILVLPSLYEGLPLVVLEALACGCRVIATALDGTKEIAEQLDSEHLILLPVPAVVNMDRTVLDDEEHFVQRLQEALGSCFSKPTDALSPADLSHYHWNSVFRRIQAIWSQCSPDTA